MNSNSVSEADETFFRWMFHEFRVPITGIRNNLDSLINLQKKQANIIGNYEDIVFLSDLLLFEFEEFEIALGLCQKNNSFCQFNLHNSLLDTINKFQPYLLSKGINKEQVTVINNKDTSEFIISQNPRTINHLYFGLLFFSVLCSDQKKDYDVVFNIEKHNGYYELVFIEKNVLNLLSLSNFQNYTHRERYNKKYNNLTPDNLQNHTYLLVKYLDIQGFNFHVTSTFDPCEIHIIISDNE